MWVAALALSAFVGLASFVVVNELKAPLKSLIIGVPPGAGSKGNAAYLLYYTRKAQHPKATVSPHELRMAGEAYRTAPLQLPALAIIAEARRAGAEQATRPRLLEFAGRLSRRNSAVTAQLVELAALRQDQKSFFAWLSRAALTSNHQRDGYVAAMALGTARPGAVDALTPVLGANPAWADFYWLAVAKVPESLSNAAKVRIAIAQKPWNRTEIVDNDRRLLRALVAGRQFDAARQVFDVLSPASKPSASFLVNTGFARQPQLPPFDWELAASGDLGSTVIPKERALMISAIGGARGMAARQLVALPGGNYNLGWKLSGASADQAKLAVRIGCAEAGNRASASFPLKPGAHSRSISAPAGECNWYWFTITAALDDTAPGIDVFLRDLSLTRASGPVRAEAAPQTITAPLARVTDGRGAGAAE
jgi:hypothetical protein